MNSKIDNEFEIVKVIQKRQRKASVHVVKRIGSGEQFVMKSVESECRKMASSLKKEWEISRDCIKELVVFYKERAKWVDGDQVREVDYILQEYMQNGDLFNVVEMYPLFQDKLKHMKQMKDNKEYLELAREVEENPLLPVGLVLHLGSEVSQLVDQLHQKGVAHLDLKLENVLLRDDCSLALCDMGSSMQCKEGGTQLEVGQGLGTDLYMSPEVYRHKQSVFRSEQLDLFKVDSWALGIMLFGLTFGEFPWNYAQQGDNKYSLFINHRRHFWTRLLLQQPPQIKEVARLIEPLLEPEVHKRITVRQFIKLIHHSPLHTSQHSQLINTILNNQTLQFQ